MSAEQFVQMQIGPRNEFERLSGMVRLINLFVLPGAPKATRLEAEQVIEEATRVHREAVDLQAHDPERARAIARVQFETAQSFYHRALDMRPE